MVTALWNHLIKWTAVIYLTYISIWAPWLKCNQMYCLVEHYYSVLYNLTLIYLYDILMLFERLIFDFGGAFEQYLSPNADIVACPQLEAAIVKCIKGV